MIHLDAVMKDKSLNVINDFLAPVLDDDETVIAVFRASRLKPLTNIAIATNHRLLVGRVEGKKFSLDIAAEDIAEFNLEKGRGKITKLSIAKKDGGSVYVGIMGEEDIKVLQGLLPRMSGTPQALVDNMRTAKKQAVADKTQEKELRQADKVKEREAKRAAEQVQKEAELAKLKTRGRRLGYAYLTYNGGFGDEFKKNSSASLTCYENEVIFESRKAPIVIPADQITGFEITGQKHSSTTSRITVTRMVTLGVFSLAAPKRSTVTEKETNVYITLKDGRQLFFNTTAYTSDIAQRKLSDAISHYGRLQAAQSGQSHQAVQVQDAAGEIERFAELRQKGILTEAEFQAKKKQLLGL